MLFVRNGETMGTWMLNKETESKARCCTRRKGFPRPCGRTQQGRMKWRDAGGMKAGKLGEWRMDDVGIKSKRETQRQGKHD